MNRISRTLSNGIEYSAEINNHNGATKTVIYIYNKTQEEIDAMDLEEFKDTVINDLAMINADGCDEAAVYNDLRNYFDIEIISGLE